MREIIYVYHVSYHFIEKQKSGNGSTQISSTRKVITSSTIVKIRDYIKKKNKFDACVITGMIFLNREVNTKAIKKEINNGK